MSKVTVQTITPVHVGSGNFLRYNSDFVTWADEEQSFIGIIDPKKMLSIIGVDHLDDWVHTIERNGNTKEFMKNVGGCTNPEKYVKRIIYNNAEVKSSDTLKECIHDGMGRAYIPGSSIKGSIRTVLLASLANQVPNKESKVVSINHKGKKNVSAKTVEQQLFGGDPNSDIFRFLHIGDAYFKDCEISSRLINLNIRERENLIDGGKPQIVESIFTEGKSIIQMKIDSAYYDWAQHHWPQNSKNRLGSMPESMSSLESLFALINAHTTALVKDEIEYWENVQSCGYSGAAPYIDCMKEVLRRTCSCQKGKECILRLGHASGWRFITGAWAEHLSNFETDIVPASRPKNDAYNKYDFPKSRRIEEIEEYDGEKETSVFGFIKLTLS